MAVSTYSTWADVFHQFPVDEIANLDSKVGYVTIKSVALLDSGEATAISLKGWWGENRPAPGSIVAGVFQLASNGKRVELVWDRSQVEVAPGDPEDEEAYVGAHFSGLPMQVHAFGLVTARDDHSFTIVGKTYAVEDKVSFEIKFVTDKEGTLPRVGTFAGGLGIVTSAEDGVIARLEYLEDDVPHGAKFGTAAGRKGGSASSKWSNAWSSKKKASTSDGSTTASNTAGSSSTASTSAVGSTASSTPAARTVLSTKNSYCVSSYRFLLLDHEKVNGITIVTGRTITTKEDALDFRMQWTMKEDALVGGIYHMCVWVGFDKETLVFEAVDDRIELRPGAEESATYMDNQLFKQAWRVRVAGKVIESNARSFTLESRVNTGAGVLTTITHWLVPNTKRWEKYKPVGMAEVIGARGTVQTIEAADGEEPRLICGLEELRNAVREVDMRTEAGMGKRGNGPKSAWTARSKAMCQSTTLPGTATASVENGGDIEVAPSSSGTTVLTEAAFQLMVSKRGRENSNAEEGAEKRARTEDSG